MKLPMLYFYIQIVLQVVLESIPVSSSAHVQLLERFVHFYDAQSVFNSMFLTSKLNKFVSVGVLDHLLHAPTILIVMIFFRAQWLFLFKNLQRHFLTILKIMCLVIISDFMTSLFFILFKVMHISLPLSFGLSVTAALLYSLRWCKKKGGSFSYKTAFLLGCAQGVSLISGISRFGTVYVCARWLGISHRRAFEITWLIQWPLICAATLHGIYVLYAHDAVSIMYDPILILVTLCSMIVSYIVLYGVERLARYNYLWIISFYMLVPVLLSLFF